MGREVILPDTIQSVIALKSGTMRLLSYMGVTDLVSHIEESEKRRNVPYLFANPHLRSLSVIGAGNNYDTELLATASSDMIVATYMSPQEADRLQRLTQKPVVLLDYGDLNYHRENLYATLSLLGKIFHLTERSDTIIKYIEATISACASRASIATERPGSVYLGGVAYNGAHGITSTETDYPPFLILSLNPVTGGSGLNNSAGALSHEVLSIDPEQLLNWDPDIIFLDAAGRQIWEKEINGSAMFNNLSAMQSGKMFTVLPYNWNTTNYENVLCNIWYIGSVMLNSSFRDIDYIVKSREIYRFFYGKDIFDEVDNYYKPFRPYEKDIEK
jgi:iron complex transport system substrate-binding protein